MTGFTIVETIDRVGAELVELYRSVAPSTLGHVIEGRTVAGVLPVTEGSVLVGPAVTVQTRGRDSTVCHKVLDLVQPGDVIVIAQDGGDAFACWGEMMTLAAKLRGVAGVVVDGPLTDTLALRRLGLPVFGRGRSPLTTQLLGEGGGINCTITCGGVAVNPGCLVLGSDDGVLVLSCRDAEEFAVIAQDEERADAEYRTALLAGKVPSALAPIDRLIAGRV